jgi:hypothetical protein
LIELIFHWAEKLSRGCGWFAALIGGAAGAGVGYLSQRGVLLDPNVSHQLLTHVLFGHLPTFLVSSFVLLRVSFQLATESQMRVAWTQGHQAAVYSIACAMVSLMAWAWFFLAAVLGCWLGMMIALSGYALPGWQAFWIDFDFNHLLHAALRMLTLALALSVMTFVEVNFLQTHRNQLSLLMARFMTIGMLLIAGIELLDVTLM